MPSDLDVARDALARTEESPDGCLRFTGSLTRGYATLSRYAGDGKQKMYYGHTVVWKALVGPIPDEMVIDHVCHDPTTCPGGKTCPHRACLNVKHMELASRGDNSRRSARWNVRPTHCPQGHPYDETNTYWNGNNRFCRKCGRAATYRWYHERRRG